MHRNKYDNAIFGLIMKVTRKLFSVSANIDSLLASMVAFVMILIYSKPSGIGISPDSVTYLSAARNMVRGHGFISFDNLPTVDFPFAYPFFLTITSFVTTLDPVVFAPWVNAVLFALLLYAAGAMMNGFAGFSGWYKRIVLLSFLLTPALQEVYSMVWSETIFLILLLIFIFCVTRYLQVPGLRWLLFTAVVCAFACITRYAGIFLVPAALAVICSAGSQPWKRRLVHSLLLGFISISLLVVNIFRNMLLTGLATGPRPRSHLTAARILDDFGGVMSDWLFAVRFPGLNLLIAVFVLLVFVSNILFHSPAKRRGIEYVIAVTGLSFCLFMLFTSALTRYEVFSNRLLSPLFILLPWTATSWLPGFVSRQSVVIKAVITLFILFISSLFLTVQLRADYEFYDGVRDAGIPGYQEDPFVQTAIVQFIRTNTQLIPANATVYSNAADAFYFVTGKAARQLPFIDFPDMVNRYYQVKSTPEYLVWFSDESNPQMPDLSAILRNKKLQLVKQLSDGAVYVSVITTF